MQYSEDYTWPLTSSTTIYSGARRLSSSLCLAGDDDDEHDHSASTTTRLATEYNTVQVPITKSNNNNNNNNNNSITSSFDSSVAYHDEQYYVVGYDSLKEWEVLILLNRSEDNKKDGQQATTRTTTTTTTTGVADAAVPSMAAMTTSSTSLEHEDPSSSSSQPNTTTTTTHRHYPSGETDVIASMSLTTNTHDSAVPSILSDSHTTATMGLIDEHSVQPITASATTATIVTETTNNNNNPHTPSRAKILLRNRQTGQEYQQALSTRPLAPTLCLVDNKHVLLWLGNADLNVLQLWYPSSLSSSSSPDDDHDHDQNLLVLYPNVPLEMATVTSPVMAVDVLLLENLHNTTCALALACQNGTIQLSVFTIQCQVDNDATEHCSVVSLQFTDIQHVSVVVDGPIVSVHLQNHLETIQAVAGSLCGYVCEMVYSKHTRQWSRPYMVAEGFTRRRRRQQQRQQQSEEDSVLSVHAFETFVFVGTFTGKCLVYEKTLQASADDEYQLLWQCQLPYSVHQIVAMSTTRFVVTTRRSVHLFGGKRIHYDVELAHQRLCELLRERKIVPTVVESQVEATVVPAAETTTSSSEGTGATQLELTDTQEGIEIKSSTEHVTTVEQ